MHNVTLEFNIQGHHHHKCFKGYTKCIWYAQYRAGWASVFTHHIYLNTYHYVWNFTIHVSADPSWFYFLSSYWGHECFWDYELQITIILYCGFYHYHHNTPQLDCDQCLHECFVFCAMIQKCNISLVCGWTLGVFLPLLELKWFWSSMEITVVQLPVHLDSYTFCLFILVTKMCSAISYTIDFGFG